MAHNNDGRVACDINRPWLDDGDVQLYHGDVREQLELLPAGIARTCITSPPYWGLRDYGVDGQIGLEPTLSEFIEALVGVFRSVRRVLADDGTLWVNMGDSYVGSRGGPSGEGTIGRHETDLRTKLTTQQWRKRVEGLKTKDMMAQHWRLALALQDDGWYLRSDVVWEKPDAMPESVRDRPSRSHEYLFLLSKSKHYHYDADAIREPAAPRTLSETRQPRSRASNGNQANAAAAVGHPLPTNPLGRNKRTVWRVPTANLKAAHFATFPPSLIEPCILASSAPGDIVLDPFMGSGTTASVARTHGRRAIGVELNEDYLRLAAARLSQQSLLTGDGA